MRRSCSNEELRNKLGWERDKYFLVRNAALAAGRIGIRRGRGGVVYLIEAPAAPATEAQIQTDQQEYLSEQSYYEPLAKTMREDWAKAEGADQFVVEVTANRRVRGSGRWTVPDIIFVGKIVYQYAPKFEFYLQSLEVKRFEALDALGVFEALNHRRASHYTYLCVVNVPPFRSIVQNELLSQITEL